MLTQKKHEQMKLKTKPMKEEKVEKENKKT
jgi:hypothetical protein